MEKHYHFIGIGGIGMSALARILLMRGAKVSGSDLNHSPLIEELKDRGADISLGHKAELISAPMIVVYNTDIPKNNPEYLRALELKLPLVHRSDVLWEMMKDYEPLLVTGTHGKTTTSSLLAHVLKACGLDPSYAIGGVVRSLGSNGENGEGNYFVAEADESDGSFLKYAAFGAIVTNIDNDHLNHWGSEQALLEGFKKFSSQVRSSSHFFWCSDDKQLKTLALKGVSYGFQPEAQARILQFKQLGWTLSFDLFFDEKLYENIEIPLIGKHNILNATAVFCLALRLNILEHQIREAFKNFQGVGRRVDKKGEVKEIQVYDDYAHHPTEIETTLKAIRFAEPDKRLVVAFQPHRYTRTRDCLNQFPGVFDLADEVILTDIYSAGEMPLPGVNTEVFFKKIQEKTNKQIHYVPRSSLVSFLTSFLRSQDVLLTMGAGDITKVGPELLRTIQSS